MLKSLDQERSKYAWKCIGKVKELSDGDKKSYASYVAKASSLILTNGLGNTLAFFNSKDEVAYKMLFDHISGRIKDEMGIQNKKDILRWIEETSSINVFYATKIALKLLDWLKRFAEAELRK